MTDPITEAVRRLRGLREDVERLKAARDEEGEVRILRLVFDPLGIGDQAEATSSERPDASDQLAVGDVADARDNDAAATDAAASGDAVSASTDEAGGWTWDESHYDFDEWS